MSVAGGSRLGLGVAALALIEQGQVVERDADIAVIMTFLSAGQLP
jgi:hypothetical protein